MFDVKLYFSGTVAEEVDRYILQHPGSYRLTTFAYPKEVYEYLNLANEMGVKCHMLLDSGAFTAWSIGKPVQLNELIEYNDNVVNTYGPMGHTFNLISLDVIPGDKGRRPLAEELAQSVERSKDNFAVMQQHFAGRAQVLPVYHTGEDVALRNHYMAMTDYLCLSMDQTMSERDRVGWATRAAVDGWRYHGLAATGNRMVTEVNWHSVDSSSWVTVGSMGGILWPTPDHRFRVLPLSDNSPSRHDKGNHLLTLTDYERGRVENYIASLGFDVATLQTTYQQRWKWNVAMWMNPPWRRNVQKPVDLFEGLA